MTAQMNDYYKLDGGETGCIIDRVAEWTVESAPAGYHQLADGAEAFRCPSWNGTAWEEGQTQTEIDAETNAKKRSLETAICKAEDIKAQANAKGYTVLESDCEAEITALEAALAAL